MANYFLLWLLILVGGTLLCYVIVKSLLKTLATFFFILFLFFAITITLTYSDWQQIQTDLTEKEGILILHDDSHILFSVVKKNLGNFGIDTAGKSLSETPETIQTFVNKREYASLLHNENYSKLFLINKSLYNPLPEQFQVNNKLFIKTELFAQTENQALAFETRADAYDHLNQALLEQEGIFYIIEQHKSGSLSIYPQTMVLRMIQILPTSWALSTFPASSSNEESLPQ